MGHLNSRPFRTTHLGSVLVLCFPKNALVLAPKNLDISRPTHFGFGTRLSHIGMGTSTFFGRLIVILTLSDGLPLRLGDQTRHDRALQEQVNNGKGLFHIQYNNECTIGILTVVNRVTGIKQKQCWLQGACYLWIIQLCRWILCCHSWQFQSSHWHKLAFEGVIKLWRCGFQWFSMFPSKHEC